MRYYGEINPPSSKSISHRMLISSFVSKKYIKIDNINLCKDVKCTISALEQLGAKYEKSGTSLTLKLIEKINQNEEIIIDCKESATTLRMLLPIATLFSNKVTFKGKKSLFSRPLTPLLEIFDQQNIHYELSDSSITVSGSLKDENITIDGSISSQFISGILYFYCFQNSKNILSVANKISSEKYINLTIDSLQKFGYFFKKFENSYSLNEYKKITIDCLKIEPDFSSISNFALLGCLRGNIKIKNANIDTKQPDFEFINILKNNGGNISFFNNEISFEISKLSSSVVNIDDCIDLGPIMFVYGAFADGSTTIQNVNRLTLKESDRLNNMIKELRKAGVEITKKSDSVLIKGKKSYPGGVKFKSHNDHRIEMALSIFSCLCDKRCAISNKGCVNKSYPNFYNDLTKLCSQNITAGIYQLDTLKVLRKQINTAILMVPHLSYIYNNDFDIVKALTFCDKYKIEPILAINRIFMEDELSKISDFIDKYSNRKFIISDLGVAEIFRQKGLIQNVIFDSSTMVCNSMDFSLYSSFGFDAVSMSNEIPLRDVISTNFSQNKNMFYQVFGRKMMFYSKRKLLNLYQKHSGTSFTLDNLSLIEEKRPEQKMPVFENENGFYCFRDYYISLHKEFKDLIFLKYAYFETITLSDKEILKTIKLFKKSIFEYSARIDKKLDINIKDGFTYDDTNYVKEKMFQ